MIRGIIFLAIIMKSFGNNDFCVYSLSLQTICPRKSREETASATSDLDTCNITGCGNTDIVITIVLFLRIACYVKIVFLI